MDREDFHLPGKHYFLSHSVGAQPKAYAEALTHGFMGPWRTEGFDVWPPWFDALERFKTGLAPVIGASPADICPQPNVSSGIAKILFSLPERARRTKIVLTEDDFPTVGFALGQAQRMDYELVFLPGGERLADPDAWAPAFHDDVQLVVATQVYSNSSVLAPCAEIARRARERGVFSIFDIAQAAGAVPVNLDAWGADFAVGTSLKYLCGGTGAAYLWAAPDAAERCAPLDVGWFSHADPFEFDIHHFAYAPGAARYTGGTPSIAPFAGASAAHELLNRHGIDAIYAHNQKLLTR
ncbi:MAG: aminotransferase class V-fold PLP-dependent enzyme, partial [Hyphococcus sp.]